MMICKRCGVECERRSSTQKYCKPCAREHNRERHREYMREYMRDPENHRRQLERKRERRRDPENRRRKREYLREWHDKQAAARDFATAMMVQGEIRKAMQ